MDNKTEHKTGLEEIFVIRDQKKLRCGYTTGSCAAAAAKASVYMLLSGKRCEEVALMTPKGILLHLLIEEIQMEENQITCAVRKDGGDDPDATNGILIYATVKKDTEKGVFIDGGRGVGRVTKPGLNQPVGNAAINDTPRRMIKENVEEVCQDFKYEGGISVLITIPEGEEIAEKTFNPRLGIVGGISVLGTSGIVMPMSEEALIRSIQAEMQMLYANGGKYLLITPGNYGETFSHNMENLDLTYEMKCSNFVGETLDMAVNMGVEGILFISHIGKFVKVSGGIMNTHSHNADSRAELIAAAAARSGADIDTVCKLLAVNTTEEALDVLADTSMTLYKDAMQNICDRARFYMMARSKKALKIGLILFSSVRGELARTANVDEMIQHVNTQE